MADICGPFTLDQLDQFGKVDAIQITFDSPIWQSTDTCITLNAGSASALATVIGIGNGIFAFQASVTGVAASVLDAIRMRLVEGLAASGATVSGDAIRVRLTSSSVTGTASTSGLGGVVYSGDANVFAFSTTEAIAWKVLDGSGSITGIAFVSADGGVLGEEWSLVSADANTWNELASGSEVWVAVPEGTNTWLLRG
jgi:hypothetical protein